MHAEDKCKRPALYGIEAGKRHAETVQRIETHLHGLYSGWIVAKEIGDGFSSVEVNLRSDDVELLEDVADPLQLKDSKVTFEVEAGICTRKAGSKVKQVPCLQAKRVRAAGSSAPQ